MKKKINLNLNYFFADNIDTNELIKKEFYAARDWLFSLKFDEYVELKALPLSPKDEHVFSSLVSYRVKTKRGNYRFINFFIMGFGGILVTDEM